MRPRNEKDPFISTTSPKASFCPIPDCFACRTAKAHRLPDNSTVEEKVSSKDGILKAENLKPGSVISVDQYVSKVKGQLKSTAGKEGDMLK